MNLRQALRVDGPVRLALVGAGGKTTAMFTLGEQISGPVILTASTHLSVAQALRAGRHVIVTNAEEIHAVIEAAHTTSTLLLTGRVGGDGRSGGLDDRLLEAVHSAAGRRNYPILVEADGSRRKPLKAPAAHEPAIPGWVDTVVVVVGLSGLGKPLDAEYVHRPEIFSALTGLKPGEFITPDAICAFLNHPDGGQKSIPHWARKVVVLNQADTLELQTSARKMAPLLLAKGYDLVILSMLEAQDAGRQVVAAFQPTAGIVLAAGGAQRFGQPKVLLDWDGKPLVRQVAETALQAGLSPVRVVCGGEEAAIRAALDGLAVQVVPNPDWEAGQSTSVAAGLKNLNRRTGGAVFLLADQPLVTAGVIQALVMRHDETLSPIVAPRVDGRRANPVLFDQSCFAELSQLRGDTGGRGLFDRFEVEWVEQVNDDLLFDIDTPEDYRRLLERARRRG